MRCVVEERQVLRGEGAFLLGAKGLERIEFDLHLTQVGMAVGGSGTPPRSTVTSSCCAYIQASSGLNPTTDFTNPSEICYC